MLLQHVGDDLPDAAVADDDGVPASPRGTAARSGWSGLLLVELWRERAARRRASSGISAMVSEVTASVKLRPGAQSPSVVAMPMTTKANSPPGAEQETGLDRWPPVARGKAGRGR